MEKKIDLQSFLMTKIKSVDNQLLNQKDQLEKLRLATMRASYSKVKYFLIQFISNFLKDQKQLAKSYFQQSKIYLNNSKIDQAICQAQLAKRKISNPAKNNQEKILLQNINLLLVQCNLENKKLQDAQSIIDDIQISTDQNKQKYLSLKGKIYQSLERQPQSRQIYQQLYQIVIDKYGKNSLEDGLCLIQMGKNQGQFSNYDEAIDLLNQGIQILINKRYQNPQHVATIYESLAEYCRQIQDFQKQYSSLICAFSMIKQLKEIQQKRTIQVLNKLSNNLLKKDDKQKALEYLIQVEQIQRKIHGQSSANLSKTVKKIINILTQLNRLSEVKKYQNQYEHLLGNNKPSLSRMSHNNLKTAGTTMPPSSIQRQKLQFSNNKEQQGFSRVLKN